MQNQMARQVNLAQGGKRYDFVKAVGKGAYGVVSQAKRITDGKMVAMKKVLKLENNTYLKRLLRELALLRILRGGENIVNLIDILPPSDLQNFKTITFVLEYIDTDLRKMFHSNQFWRQRHIPYIMYQLFLGLNYMHSMKICHRDLKPANVLMNARCKVRIADFGLARSWNENEAKRVPRGSLSKKSPARLQIKPLSSKSREPTCYVVSRNYRAPEVILLQQNWDYIGSMDIWAAGCIMAELLQMLEENCSSYERRRMLFPGRTCWPLSPGGANFTLPQDQLRKIMEVLGTPSKKQIRNFSSPRVQSYLSSYRYKKPQSMRVKFPASPMKDVDLLLRCLAFVPTDRITAKQALAHKCFESERDLQREKTAEPVTFPFEDVDMSDSEIRSLIVDEMLLYNEDLRKKHDLELGSTKSGRNLRLFQRNSLKDVNVTAPEVTISEKDRLDRGVYSNDESMRKIVQDKISKTDKSPPSTKSPNKKIEQVESPASTVDLGHTPGWFEEMPQSARAALLSMVTEADKQFDVVDDPLLPIREMYSLDASQAQQILYWNRLKHQKEHDQHHSVTPCNECKEDGSDHHSFDDDDHQQAPGTDSETKDSNEESLLRKSGVMPRGVRTEDTSDLIEQFGPNARSAETTTPDIVKFPGPAGLQSPHSDRSTKSAHSEKRGLPELSLDRARKSEKIPRAERNSSGPPRSHARNSSGVTPNFVSSKGTSPDLDGADGPLSASGYFGGCETRGGRNTTSVNSSRGYEVAGAPLPGQETAVSPPSRGPASGEPACGCACYCGTRRLFLFCQAE